jgi:epoxyqueuosine reductase
MKSVEITGEKIKKKASELGFYQCGFAKVEALEEDREVFLEYLASRRNAGIHYLERNPESRLDPHLIFPDAKSIVAVLMNYFPATILPDKDNYILSKYTYGKDYHTVITGKLKELGRYMKQECGATLAKGYVDTSPLLEKRWAQRCGLGWIGKNTILLNNINGSFHFVGILLTDLVPDYDPPGTDHCGSCDKCIRACPTGALIAPHKLEPAKCIAYLTLESKGPLPEDLKDLFMDRICGCDICQDVCPYNKSPKPNPDPDLQPHPALMNMHKKDWLNLTKESFHELFADRPVSHTGYDRLMRNIRFLSEDSALPI